LHRRQIFDWKHHALVLISYVKNLRNRRSLLVPLRGFTLAEVLITLGIIGVVAALTIPTLMQQHRRHVVETKFKEAVSILKQANALSKVDYGLNYNRESITPINNPDSAYEYFNKYYVPYIKFRKVEKGTKGVWAYLFNG
ncbi:prepilin-type N-terminal cleavage/methylation domain-containing protein, partial [bacterium]|nr:prepilin-type N-terminal cleavage/methylation domain-containing protein [bacterium]